MINLLIISTNRYKEFVQPLLNGVIKNFFSSHQITVHLFTDELQELIGDNRVRIEQHLISPYRFPEASMLRYRVFTDHAQEIKGDWIFYLDVDTEIVAPVEDNILIGDIIAVRHPGFYTNNGWGSESTDSLSLAYLLPENRKHYYCGGTQGGRRDHYLTMCARLADNLDIDIRDKHIPEYHDETAFNWFVNFAMGIDYPDWKLNELTPEYCSVPEPHQREAWGIAHLTPRIIALTKNHDYFRN